MTILIANGTVVSNEGAAPLGVLVEGDRFVGFSTHERYLRRGLSDHLV